MNITKYYNISSIFLAFAMAEQTNIFGMLNVEDKLDGTNYPMWAYMMRHEPVAKQLWDIVIRSNERPTSSSSPNSPSP